MRTTNPDLASVVDVAFESLREGLKKHHASLITVEVGVVTSVSMGTATVSGLPGARFEELLEFLGDSMLVAHNARFDFGFLNHELGRCGRAATTSPSRAISRGSAPAASSSPTRSRWRR